MKNAQWLAGLMGVAVAGCMAAQALGQERHRLYTETNPSDTGGIKGTITEPSKPIVQVMAMPPDEPRFVYLGTVTGEKGTDFRVDSLPMGIYDLFVIYDNDYYEGLELHPTKSTLTDSDIKKITYIITESQPYFNKKTIHRVEGTTGRGNVARCVVSYLRDKPSSGTTKWRRTVKLVWLKDVGPGWQVVQTRDLYPVFIEEKHAHPKDHFCANLSHIRVTDKIKDLGRISLTTPSSKPLAGKDDTDE